MENIDQKISFSEANHRVPEERYLRLWQIIGGKGFPAMIPVSKSSWWAGIKEGIYPAPTRLGKRISVWKQSAIERLIKN